MNAETKKMTGSPLKRIVPSFCFSIACLLLLAVGMAAWQLTSEIGAAYDNIHFIAKPAFLLPTHSSY
jgi:hypothetical protein